MSARRVKRAKIYEGDHAARMIYLDSRSLSLNDRRPSTTSAIVCGGLRAIATAAWKAVTAIKRLQRLWDLRRGWRDISPAGVSTHRDEYGRL